ncbi:MAG: ABC transporter permease, partial [Alphaproteobacteria bacterium]
MTEKARGSTFGGLLPWLVVSPAVLWTLAFFAAPFIAMAVVSLTLHEGGGFSFANYQQFFSNPSYYQALVNSLEVTLIVTVISILLAYPFAWILAEQIPEKWQRLALILAVLPFWTSYVVRSYSWLLVLAEKGVVNNTLLQLGLIAEPIQLANTRFATVVG